MSENAKIVKNSAILYIRLIFVSLIGLISSRYILEALGVSDFGLYNVVGGIVTMMSFLNVVMISTTYRFIAFELAREEQGHVNKVFNISLLIHIILAVLVIIFAFSFGLYYIVNFLKVAEGKLDDAIFVFLFSILGIVLSIIVIPFQALLTAKEKFAITAPIEIFKSLFSLIVILLVMNYAGNRLRLYAMCIAIVTSLPPIMYYVFCKMNYSTIIKWKLQRDKKKYQEMIRFSGWIMLGAGASVGENQGSALIINSFFGTILNSSFGIANQVNSFVKMFSQSLSQAVIPQITKSYSIGQTERTEKLVIYASKYSFFLMLLPAFPLLLETNFVMTLWLTVVPVFTTSFVQIMLINALIVTMCAGIPAAVHATGKIKYFQIILSFITLSGLPLGYAAFYFGAPPYSILWVYTFLSVTVFVVVLYLAKLILKFNLKVFFRKGLLRMLMVVIVTLPVFLIKDFFEPSLMRFFFISGLCVLWLVSAIYYVGIESDERNIIKMQLRKINNKLKRN
jgi:O-antigen/teichoic acid export membrane protein